MVWPEEPVARRMISRWEDLLQIALDLIGQSPIGDDWTFGGGTAMMLQIDHRVSNDIDLFVGDPQYLGYLDPARRNFGFAIEPTRYDGDGSRFLKIAFADVGQIDFIACAQLTDPSWTVMELLGRSIKIETMPEIITKKVFYRGTHIAPRDVFDIAAASATHGASIIAALSEYRTKTAIAADTLRRLNSDFVLRVIDQLQVKPAFEYLKPSAIDECLDVFSAAIALSNSKA